MPIPKSTVSLPQNQWVRIPDGTKVRHRTEGYDGVIDGLTMIVSGSGRNPDGKTQYRVKVDDSTRKLVSEDLLNILLDADRLIVVGRQSELYRRQTTNRLRSVFAADRFVESSRADRTSPRRKK